MTRSMRLSYDGCPSIRPVKSRGWMMVGRWLPGDDREHLLLRAFYFEILLEMRLGRIYTLFSCSNFKKELWMESKYFNLLLI